MTNKKPIFTRVKKSSLIKGDVDKIINLPIVVLVNEFNEEASRKFYADMNDAENSEQDIIPIVVDSYGGQVYALMSMVDTIRASKKKIATISLGKSMSCGAILLSCGHDGYRFCAPRTTVLIHDVSSWTHGKVEDIKTEASEADRLNNEIYHLMDRNCGHEEGYFQKIVHDHKGHADWYLTAEEAKEHNLVNHVKIPRFEIEISVETKLV